MHAARCVIVEDSPGVLALAIHVVETICPGVEVTGFDSPLDAVEFLRANPVDLILTDFRMPFVDGLHLIAAVRTVDRQVPIVLMSGEPMEAAALAAGASAFVRKPDLFAQLRDILGALGLSAQRIELQSAANHRYTDTSRR